MEYQIIKAMKENGDSQRKIAKELGIGQTTVRYWLNKYKLNDEKEGAVDIKYSTKKCINCGKEIIQERKTRGNKYCDKECYIKGKINKKLKMLEECKYKTQHSLRDAMFLIREKKCVVCGLDKWNGKEIPLVLDHIDGNSENNKVENLRFICCNCDAQTETYKSKNRGNGRYARRIRAKNGKSY